MSSKIKVELLEKTFPGVDINNLEINMRIQCRDGKLRYCDKTTNNNYTYDLFKKVWYKGHNP